MPQNQSFDSGELRSLAIGYDKLSAALSPDVRLIDGVNMMVTNKGKLNKRPGTVLATNPTVTFSGQFIDHLVGFETLDTVPIRAILSSIRDVAGSFYLLNQYTPVTGTGGVSSIRGINHSLLPHEIAVSRGTVYVKGFDVSHSNDPLQSISYNAGTGATNLWGLVGPTIPSAVTAGVASTFNFTVNFGWYYVYTWKTSTGQESNRSPLQQDQSKVPSSTGPIANFCPSVVVQGNADTVNIPTICIYRSTDGGGNFYKLEEITNTGAGAITYVDRDFPDGLTVPSQPYPDSALDTTKISPTLVSNSPPPTVLAQDVAIGTLNGAINNSTTVVTLHVGSKINGTPLANVPLDYTITVDQEQMKVTVTAPAVLTVVRGINGTVSKSHADGASVRYTPITGIDPPQRCTPIANFAGRLWYGIGNVLFYSGNEEIAVGVPEECWPSGINGNFYRFNFPITNVVSTSEALYVICTEEVYWLKGYTKDSFQLLPIFTDLGGVSGHPRAICTADKSIIFLTNDLRVCMARGYKRDFLSDQLADDLLLSINGSLGPCNIHMARFAYQEKDLLFVLAQPNVLSTDTTLPSIFCKQWVYDFNQTDNGLWNVPWRMPASTVQGCYLDMSGNGLGKYLIMGMVEQGPPSGNGDAGYSFVDFTFNSVQDSTVFGSIALQYSASFTISLVRNPTGNHVNMLREPGMVSVQHAVKLDRTTFPGDSNPRMDYFLDNSTSFITGQVLNPEPPPRRVQSQGYDTLWYMVDTACERISVRFTKDPTVPNERFECQMIAFVFNPDSGA